MGGASRENSRLRSLDRSTMSSCKTTSSSEADDVSREVKVVVVGPSRTGKTSLIQRFVNDKFSDTYVPTNFEKYTTRDCVNNTPIKYSIWDVSGASSYDSIRPLAYPDANVFILCFSVTDPDSFHMAVNKWLPEIRSHCPNTPMVFCGCASDLRNDVQTLAKLSQSNFGEPIAKEYATRNAELIGAVDYIETSSAYGDDKGVYEVFAVAAKAALAHITISMIYDAAMTQAKSATSLNSSVPKKNHNTLNCMRIGSKKKDKKSKEAAALDSDNFIYHGVHDSHMQVYYQQRQRSMTLSGKEHDFEGRLKKGKNCSIM